MNKNPIGIIDSGMGGLTVAFEIIRQLPQENIIYLGDVARCPYGDKNEYEIIEYTNELIDYLLTFEMKMLVIACNTATAYTYKLLMEKLDIPVIGVIDPGARTAIKKTKHNKIGVIATQATIDSNLYTNTILKIDNRIDVIAKSTPEFVPLIEKGFFQGGNIDTLIDFYLKDMKNNIDTLILGCTHYPFIQKSIENYLGEGVEVVSSGEETAREVNFILELFNIKNEMRDTKYKFCITGVSISFANTLDYLVERYNISLKNLEFIQNVKLNNYNSIKELS